jgi:streptogramin lyase
MKTTKINYVASLLRLMILAGWLTSPLIMQADTPITVPPGRTAQPVVLAAGPDGNLWFTEQTGFKVGKITPAGVITEYPIAGARGLTGISAGPDGNMWFTDELSPTIAHVNTNGGGLAVFPLPPFSHPQGITAGPDGNMWFVDEVEGVSVIGGSFKIGKISMSGKVTEYSTHLSAGHFVPYNIYTPSQITVGPDGNLWFTNPQLSAVGKSIVGKITTSGTVTFYPMSDVPIAITSGPDGNLWVTENSHVAKITTSGVETEYPLTVSYGYSGICTGSDGNLWFTEGLTVGYVTTAGVVTEFPQNSYSPSIRFLSSIAKGADGALWILGSITSNIGRVNLSGQLTNLYSLNLGSQTLDDTIGPDGAIWATGNPANLIARIDTQGTITTFPGVAGGRPAFIVAGPDGNLWFTDQGTNSIARMTTSGNITEFSVGQRFAGLWAIIAGPDGNLWFPEYAARYNNIVRITPSGNMTAYPIPTSGAVALYITPGPDGNLWFTELGAQQVAKIDPTTGNITEYPFPGINKGLAALVTGPDNNLWIMESGGYGAVAKFSTSGNLLAEYPVLFETLLDIKVGSDGALWMPQYYPNGVARITTAGVVSTVGLTTPNSIPNDVAFGSDGKMYVAEYAAGALGRMSAIGGTGDTIQATHGSPFTGAVASFVDGTPTAMQTDFTATVDWGDGTHDAGTVTGPRGGPFTVSGTHTYTNPGRYGLQVSLHDSVDNANYQATSGTAQVQ